MNVEFRVHHLNENGLKRAQVLAVEFDELLNYIYLVIPPGRYLSIVKTKLEEACFFAKKGIAEQEEFQQK